MRILSPILLALTVALGSSAALAQVPCVEAPACPDDGATATGDMTPNCFCPRPNSCPEPNIHSCVLFDSPGSDPPMQWSCRCEPEPEPDPDRTGPPPPRDCKTITCADGSAPVSDGFHCLCPSEGLCTSVQCPDGTPPHERANKCICPDVLDFCQMSHICSNGKPPERTVDNECVCSLGEPATPITRPPPGFRE
jgi:hypothetical protein